MEQVKACRPELLFIDLYFNGGYAIDILEEVKKYNPTLLVVIITSFGSVDTAMLSIQKGAFEYLIKASPVCELNQLFSKVVKMLEAKKSGRKMNLADKKFSTEVVGVSRSMQKIFKTVSKIANSDASVLITGESGSGKQLVAESIHKLSERKNEPFVHINCAGIPPDIIEQELFGNEKSLLSATSDFKQGGLELADKGTIFLDEIAELPLASQVKILKALHDKQVERTGSFDTIKLDVRVIAATNRDIEKMVEENQFRVDLYHRLKVIHINVPPLRERVEDIPILIDHFTDIFAGKYQIEHPVVTEAFYAWASKNYWPGNTRELINIIERTIVLSDGVVDVANLDMLNEKAALRSAGVLKLECLEELLKLGDLKDMLNYLESKLINLSLEQNRHNRSETARALGISRRALLYKLKEVTVTI